MGVIRLACNEKLATKEILHRFELIDNDKLCFCPKVETIQHLLFGYDEVRNLWKRVLDRLQVNHELAKWKEEFKWITSRSKGNGCKANLIKFV